MIYGCVVRITLIFKINCVNFVLTLRVEDSIKVFSYAQTYID